MPRNYQQLVSLDMQVQYAYQKLQLSKPLESADSPELDMRYRETANKMAREHPALIIPHVEICISPQCTLHCRDCANFMQFYHKPQPMDLEQVWSWIDAFLEAVDHVMTLSLIGGEPLMQKQLPQLLERVLQQPKVQMVQIVSNATLMPRDDLIAVMSNNKRCFIRFSNYGPKLSPRYQEIIQTCQEHNVLAMPQEPNIMWFDMGDCSDRHLSKKQKTEVYRRCPNECRHIWAGEFHNCPRSAQAKYLGFITDIPHRDYVPLLKLDLATRRKRIRKMYEVDYIEACNHCGFASGFKYIPCAIQAERPSHKAVATADTAAMTTTTATTATDTTVTGTLEPAITQDSQPSQPLMEQEASSIETTAAAANVVAMTTATVTGKFAKTTVLSNSRPHKKVKKRRK